MSDTIENALAEYNYIKSIDPQNPGADFNNDAACFARYCDMQANAFEKAGFCNVAKRIRNFVAN